MEGPIASVPSTPDHPIYEALPPPLSDMRRAVSKLMVGLRVSSVCSILGEHLKVAGGALVLSDVWQANSIPLD